MLIEFPKTMVNIYFLILLFHQIFDLFCSSLSLYFSINVLFRKSMLKRSVNVSLTMTVNFIFVFIFAILSLIYNIYLIIFWRPNDVIYDPRILYLTGFIPWIFINLNSIMEFFLCLDRCLALIFPFNYNTKTKLISAGLTILGFSGMFFVVVFFNNIISSFPSSSATCSFFGCFVPNKNSVPFWIKILFILINILGAITLAVLIKCILSANSEIAKRMNKIVLIMVFCTALIELTPFLIAQLFLFLTGQQLQHVIGPYGFTASTINITLSSGIYYKAFKKSVGSNIQAKMITGMTSSLVSTSNIHR